MNAEIETEAAQFTEKEYINGIFLTVYLDSLPDWPPVHLEFLLEISPECFQVPLVALKLS
jgi:hypothetical protein